ncbi:glycosyltransferase [Sphingomonadaceae bacterium G21617-S1]|nr:glycosyltransferase [Sphingomonadaceae bacterium G21617-S1]
MRIAHVTSAVSRRADGVRETIEYSSAAQLELGHDVAVFGLAPRDQRVPAQQRWAGAPLHILPHAGPLSLGFAPKLSAELKAMAPDILHAHGLWTYPPAGAAQFRRRSGTPFILSPHGMLNGFALSLSRWKKRIASQLYQDAVFSAASLLHVTCEKELTEVRDYGLRQAVAIIPNGVALSGATPRGPRSKTVLALGRIHPIKGLDRLVAAWARVEPHFPDWTLRIVGPDVDGHAGALREMAGKLGISRLALEPPLYGADKDAALATASIFILPSLTENFAMTVAESLAAATPAIVSTAAPWPAIADRGCGWWIEPEPESLAATLREAIALPSATLQEMGKRGQSWMREEFTWASVADRLVATYAWLLDPGRRPSWIVLD